MKAPKKSSINKIMARFDKELKNLLMSDLKTIKTKTGLLGTIQYNNQLTAA